MATALPIETVIKPHAKLPPIHTRDVITPKPEESCTKRKSKKIKNPDRKHSMYYFKLKGLCQNVINYKQMVGDIPRTEKVLETPPKVELSPNYNGSQLKFFANSIPSPLSTNNKMDANALLPRNTIHDMIYKGSPPLQNQMFNTVRFYSPAGRPRDLAINETTKERLIQQQFKKDFAEKLIIRLQSNQVDQIGQTATQNLIASLTSAVSQIKSDLYERSISEALNADLSPHSMTFTRWPKNRINQNTQKSSIRNVEELKITEQKASTHAKCTLPYGVKAQESPLKGQQSPRTESKPQRKFIRVKLDTISEGVSNEAPKMGINTTSPHFQVQATAATASKLLRGSAKRKSSLKQESSKEQCYHESMQSTLLTPYSINDSLMIETEPSICLDQSARLQIKTAETSRLKREMVLHSKIKKAYNIKDHLLAQITELGTVSQFNFKPEYSLDFSGEVRQANSNYANRFNNKKQIRRLSLGWNNHPTGKSPISQIRRPVFVVQKFEVPPELKIQVTDCSVTENMEFQPKQEQLPLN